MKPFAFIIITLCVLACCRPAAQLEPGSLDTHVRESLNALMASAEPGGYAVFDFDKTSIVHDVSQALWVYQIEHLRYADALFLDGEGRRNARVQDGDGFQFNLNITGGHLRVLGLTLHHLAFGLNHEFTAQGSGHFHRAAGASASTTSWVMP